MMRWLAKRLLSIVDWIIQREEQPRRGRRRAIRDLYRLHHLREFAYCRPSRRPY